MSARVPARARADPGTRGPRAPVGRAPPRRPSLCEIERSSLVFVFLKRGSMSDAAINRSRFSTVASHRSETPRAHVLLRRVFDTKLTSGFFSRASRGEVISRKPPRGDPLSNRTVAASPYLATWCVRILPFLPSARRLPVFAAAEDARVALRARLPSSSLSAWRWTPVSRRAIPSAARRRGRRRDSRHAARTHGALDEDVSSPARGLRGGIRSPRWRRRPSSFAGRGVKNLATRSLGQAEAIRPTARGSPARPRPCASVVRGRTRGEPTEDIAAALDGGAASLR